jgi:peptide/nickel transport system substrate-binding protein
LISLDTQVKPLDNVNFRRAIYAAIDKHQLLLTRGGDIIGQTATHFIPPALPGGAEAGGAAGPGFDFTKTPNGDLTLARKYMKAAGYPSGRYNGAPLSMVGDNQEPASTAVEAVQSQLAPLGIKVRLQEVPHDAMQSKFCGVPKEKVAICPSISWGKDFNDSQSLIDPMFNGKNIVPSGNVNHPMANDLALNKRMDAAESIVGPAARARAWGDLDRAVTDQAYVVPWAWDNAVNIRSKNVSAPLNKLTTAWDLAYASVK